MRRWLATAQARQGLKDRLGHPVPIPLLLKGI